MPFNVKKRNQYKAMERLRALVGDIRPSDLDGIDPAVLVERMAKRKYALHGTADGWFEAPDPYHTSPLVHPYAEMGGRWRNDFPGSGGQHINDDGDTNKNTRGNATDDDFDPNSKTDRINKMLDDAASPDGMSYVVRVRLLDGQDPDKIRAKLGEDAKYDGKSVYVTVTDFGEATRLQRQWPGAIIETMRKEIAK